jgi:hypothetical protein
MCRCSIVFCRENHSQQCKELVLADAVNLQSKVQEASSPKTIKRRQIYEIFLSALIKEMD